MKKTILLLFHNNCYICIKISYIKCDYYYETEVGKHTTTSAPL